MAGPANLNVLPPEVKTLLFEREAFKVDYARPFNPAQVQAVERTCIIWENYRNISKDFRAAVDACLLLPKYASFQFLRCLKKIGMAINNHEGNDSKPDISGIVERYLPQLHAAFSKLIETPDAEDFIAACFSEYEDGIAPLLQYVAVQGNVPHISKLLGYRLLAYLHTCEEADLQYVLIGLAEGGHVALFVRYLREALDVQDEPALPIGAADALVRASAFGHLDIVRVFFASVINHRRMIDLVDHILLGTALFSARKGWVKLREKRENASHYLSIMGLLRPLTNPV